MTEVLEDDRYQVVVNDEGEYSIWRAALSIPAGWTVVGGSAPRADCLERIERTWIDMRPRSVRAALERSRTAAEPGALERKAWNELYERGVAGVARSRAESDSVPIPEEWGQLPLAEWEASGFLLPRLQAARRWLDLGCGTGSVLAAFLQRFPGATAVGVDASQVAISLGQKQLLSDPELGRRMTLICGDQRCPRVRESFDVVYSLFSLQFLRAREFEVFVSQTLESLVSRTGSFCGTVRSTARSVPESYVADPSEPNTYLSREPHEAGMIYHHYTADEIANAARLLGGRLIHLSEKRSYREYDPAPQRAWWDFVITRP